MLSQKAQKNIFILINMIDIYIWWKWLTTENIEKNNILY